MRRALLALAALLLPIAAHAQPAPSRVGFGLTATLAHRLAGEDTLVVPGERNRHDYVRVGVTISPAGEVIDAKVLPNTFIASSGAGYSRGERYPSFDTAPALAAARRWKFTPFAYRRATVTALGEIHIRYREPPMEGSWLDAAAPFPAVDYRSLRISLLRGVSYWGSPQYRVTIEGDGTVTFTTDAPADADAKRVGWGGGSNVVAPGTHRYRIGRDALDRLIARFRDVRFFGLKPEYRGEVTDQSTVLIRFETGGKRFELVDYAGWAAGMPGAVTELEDAIDEAVLSESWVTGDRETARLLLAEGLDVHGAAARRIAGSAAWRGEAQIALDLIDAGLPLDIIVDNRGGRPPVALGVAMLLDAAGGGKARLFARLADDGWLARAPREMLAEALVRGRAGCDADIARRILGAGIDVNIALPPRHRTDNEAKTPLLAALGSYGNCGGRLDRYVAALLALGADPARTDDEGRAAIFHASDLGVLEVLLAAGARADVKDRDGRSPVFSVYSDAPARRLLEAGADHHGTDDYGRSLRRIATDDGWPATLEWLDAKGVP